jgi:hypothetical protein
MSDTRNRFMMKIVIASLAALAASVSSGPAAEPARANASDRPNVLFIAVDDLNDFPAFNARYPDAKTPHMDRPAIFQVREFGKVTESLFPIEEFSGTEDRHSP